MPINLCTVIGSRFMLILAFVAVLVKTIRQEP